MDKKIFLTKMGKALIACPDCGKTKHIDVAKLADADKEVRLKITCTSCKHTFSVVLERRQSVRKEVDLPGILVYANKKHTIKIIDISRLGLKIFSKKFLNLQIGDKISVEFTLDDNSRSRVSRDVLVKKITGEYIGASFLSDHHYDQLGPYFLFHFE